MFNEEEGLPDYEGCYLCQLSRLHICSGHLAMMCDTHALIRRKWLLVRYSSLHPTEWPGGQHIMDSRTTHAERRRDWERKTAEQVALTEAICLSGRSPQCTPKGVSL